MIKVNFFNNKEFVYGYVEFMDECLKGKGLLIEDKENNIKIYSRDHPLLCNTSLFLAERSSTKKRWFSYQYRNENEAEEMIKAFKRLIDQINSTIIEKEDKYMIVKKGEKELVRVKIGEDINIRVNINNNNNKDVFKNYIKLY